jgi:hypothetical protein
MIIALVIIGLIIVFLIVKNSKKLTPITEEVLLEGEPKTLKVFCGSCGDTELKTGEILPIDKSGCFSVKGYNTEGKEVILYAAKLTWSCSCSCVHFVNEHAIENCISCSNGLVRTIRIKYNNGISFTFKINFG